jgi:DNA repair exonuclease SbcCD nuclease subunit
MKLFIYADPHWSSYSSIVRSRGEKYSTRLENLIKTLNWVEEEAQNRHCDGIVCLGDFFDKSELNSEEITALQEIKWSNLDHYMIVGNHEMGRGNLEHSSAHLFELIPRCAVIDKIRVKSDLNTSIVFLPYILETNRKPLKEYLEPLSLKDRVIILSHNDIAGIQMGKFVSTVGFSVVEIEENCDLYINGHLHNDTDIGNKIINVGNITGQNFSEDAFSHNHKALIIDTVEKSLVPIANPYAMNFYKVNLTHIEHTLDDKLLKGTLSALQYPAVVTIKVNSKINHIVRDLLTTCDNIIECRLIMDGSIESDIDVGREDDVSLDHLKKFQQYVYDTFGTSEIVLSELERVLK